ncbi:MAG: 23S rRNA (guanosine(2251)-2'-O)-methyltransferase RlmB [Robiginitomaculum sp.]|nr:MAG: 23S rRNA (guanosine(2251)-2'-O)-methyltransferase RlmB [Robiginitomaculum sp.]
MPHKHKKNTRPKSAKNPANSTGKLWIWGTHAAEAALNNPRRKINQVLATRNSLVLLKKTKDFGQVNPVEPQRITEALPNGAVHQGIALQIDPLPGIPLDQVLSSTHGPLVMLDGVTDPRNIGAIFRSAAAFGAAAIITQDRHTPVLSGVLAKAAAGAIECVPHIAVVNLSRTLEQLAEAGLHSIGLAGETTIRLADATDERRVVLVMGAEGKGMRPNVAKHCETLAKIQIHAAMESLNVASAASVALYELGRD